MLRVEGVVVSGRGEGRKYVSMPIYSELLTKILKVRPFHGTLNISLNNLSVDELIAICSPEVVDDIYVEGGTYGGFYYWRCRVINTCNGASEEAVVLRPFRTKNPKTVVELISDKYLREALKLEDGCSVLLEFLCR
ncbi:MAG: DUF120 domain-containing protein [Sulfolobales archaeon]